MVSMVFLRHRPGWVEVALVVESSPTLPPDLHERPTHVFFSECGH